MVGAEPTDVVPVPLHSGAELLAACLGSSLCSEADEAMRLLRLEGIDVNAKDEIGRTPLHWASHHGHKELALALAANEAVDVNAKNKNGRIPLHFACQKGLKEVALKLLDSLTARDTTLCKSSSRADIAVRSVAAAASAVSPMPTASYPSAALALICSKRCPLASVVVAPTRTSFSLRISFF